MQILQINEKEAPGPVELRADEEDGESESKVTSQIFGCLQHPKKEVRYLKNIFFRL